MYSAESTNVDELQHARFVLFLKHNYLYFIKQIQSHLNSLQDIP